MPPSPPEDSPRAILRKLRRSSCDGDQTRFLRADRLQPALRLLGDPLARGHSQLSGRQRTARHAPRLIGATFPGVLFPPPSRRREKYQRALPPSQSAAPTASQKWWLSSAS